MSFLCLCRFLPYVRSHAGGVQSPICVSGLDFSTDEAIEQFVRPSRWVKLDVGGFRIFRFNWLVTLLASLVLWGCCLYVVISDGNKDDNGGKNVALTTFSRWQSWVTQNFTWLYIGTQDMWILFVLYIAYSKYGDIKLGKAHEKPEYDNFTWFAMLFSCGVAVGLYFYGVAEPMYYYRTTYAQKLIKPGFHANNDDGRAQQAMTITFFHWGVHAWSCYIVAALVLAFVSYRWNKPMTIRSAFFPLVGDVVNGVLGDCIDALSMACTTFGVCTSLGMGVQNILSGMNRLECLKGYDCGDTTIPPNDGTEKSRNWKLCIIAVITTVATLSVVVGLKNGIRWCSVFAFIMGNFTLVCLTLMDDTWYILNVYVQSFGHYWQYIIQLGFDCDAFQGLNWEFTKPVVDGQRSELLWGSGADKLYSPVADVLLKLSTSMNCQWDHDGNATTPNVTDTGLIPGGPCAKAWASDFTAYFGETSSNNYFMDYWTIFYWGWWISWVPFVGMFIATISRGRTIREVVGGAFLAPMIYCFFYLTVLGSLGIKMERIMELTMGVKPNIELGTIDCAAMGYASGAPSSVFAKGMADLGYYSIPCRPLAMRYFDVLMPYGDGMGAFLTVCSLIGITFYFTTSSDSGSYVDDKLSAGGMDEPPVLQRVYWAFTEGALACVLTWYGGNDSMKALRAISIVSGLPYTIAMCFMCTALLRACKYDQQEEDITRMTRFTTGLFDFTEGYMPKTKFKNSPPVMERIVSFLISLFCPAAGMHSMHMKLYGVYGFFFTAVLALLQGAWLALMIAGPVHNGTDTASTFGVECSAIVMLGWTFYTFMAVQIMVVRVQARDSYNIYGFIVEDFFSSVVMYPWVVSQMHLQSQNDLVVQEELIAPAVVPQLLDDGSIVSSIVPVTAIEASADFGEPVNGGQRSCVGC